jgi:hypothetical protein
MMPLRLVLLVLVIVAIAILRAVRRTTIPSAANVTVIATPARPDDETPGIGRREPDLERKLDSSAVRSSTLRDQKRPWPLPAALPDTPEIDEALKHLQMSYGREFMNYALEYRKYLDQCLAEDISGKHTVRFWLHFRVYPDRPAVGTDVEIIDDSDLTREQESAWLDCSQRFHVGRQVPLQFPDADAAETGSDDEENNGLHWAMTLVWPLEDSHLYQFLMMNGLLNE